MSVTFSLAPAVAGRCGQRVASTALGLPISSLMRTAYNRQLAVGALVHQVNDHVSEFALDCLLAGVVEMEPDQVVAHAAGNDIAAGFHVNLDGMAVFSTATEPAR